MKKRAVAKYEVGYGKPPTGKQFKKGQSGNPGGRPKGAKNKPKPLTNEGLKKIILEEAYREIPVNDERGFVTMPIAQAVTRSIAVNAAKGNPRAQKLFTDILRRTEEADAAIWQEIMERFITYIKDADHELERRRRQGLKGPEIIPHPEDIVFDEETGLPRIDGPLTHAHKRDYEAKIETIQFLEDKIEEMEKMLENEDDPDEQEELLETIEIAKNGIKMLDEAIGGWRPKD